MEEISKLLNDGNYVGGLVVALVFLSPKIYNFIKLRIKAKSDLMTDFKGLFLSSNKNSELKDKQILLLSIEKTKFEEKYLQLQKENDSLKIKLARYERDL